MPQRVAIPCSALSATDDEICIGMTLAGPCTFVWGTLKLVHFFLESFVFQARFLNLDCKCSS